MGRPRIYKLNDNYFNGILTKNMSYLLGLIASDGSISFKRGRFSYICHVNDIELLHFIRKEFDSTHPIKSFPKVDTPLNKTPYVRYAIVSKKLVNPLVNKFNFPKENKSQNNLIIPTKISTKMMHHFLRGVFDGDGSVWKTRNDDWCISFTGTKNFLLQIQTILYKETAIFLKLRHRFSKNNPIGCQIETKGSIQVDKIFKYLYKNSTFSLKRKQQKLKECHKAANRHRKRSFKYNGNEKLILEMYKQGIRQNEITKILGLVPSSVRACVQRNRKKKVIY